MNLYSVKFHAIDGMVAITAVEAPSISDAAIKAIETYPDYGELVEVRKIA